MIGNPVRIKAYKKLETELEQLKWLVDGPYTVGKAQAVEEDTGKLKQLYYVAVNGIAVFTGNGVFFEDETIARSELLQIQEHFLEDYLEVHSWASDLVPGECISAYERKLI